MTPTDWAALEERYGETRAEHLCPTCGGWWASCECDEVCGDFAFADCGLRLGHDGSCEPRR